MPIFEGQAVTGFVDLMSERAYRFRKGQPSELIQIPPQIVADEQAALGKLVETLADHDDALLEKVLEDIKPTPEELFRDMHKDLLDGDRHRGDARCRRTRQRHPPPVEGAAARCAAAGPRPPTARRSRPNGPPLAQIFKTVYAGHTGKLSYARIWSGTIADGAQLGGTRLGGIYRYVNGDLTKVPEAKAGRYRRTRPARRGADRRYRVARRDAGAAALPASVGTGLSLAITTTDRKDDVKLSGALHEAGGGGRLAVRHPEPGNR